MIDTTEMFHSLCWLLECEMATLEGLKGVKRTSKSELKRHQSIVDQMVAKVHGYCRDYGFGIDIRKGRVTEAVRRLEDGEDA